MSPATPQTLVKSYERISFVCIFILATLLGRVLANLLLNQAVFDDWAEKNGILSSVVTGLLTGTFVGAFQWLVLRRYVPDKMWIVATSAGMIFVSLISALMAAASQSLVLDPLKSFTIPPVTTMVLFSISRLIASLSGLYLLGYLQLRVLRPHTVNANWWSFWPMGAGALRLVHFFPAIFFGMIMPQIQPTERPNMLAIEIASLFGSKFLILPIWAATQAIAFCFLNRKPPTLNAEIIDNPPAEWLRTPELASYWRTLVLYVPLYRKITRSWKSDLTIDQRLSYRIGVSAQGEIMGYEPNAPMASEYVDQTPLAALVSSAPTDIAVPLARFNVTFAPPAEIYLSPLRQISRRRLMITTYLIIVVTGLVSALVVRSLPSKFGDLVFRLFN